MGSGILFIVVLDVVLIFSTKLYQSSHVEKSKIKIAFVLSGNIQINGWWKNMWKKWISQRKEKNEWEEVHNNKRNTFKICFQKYIIEIIYLYIIHQILIHS